MAATSREILQREIENGRLLTERTSEGDVDGVKELLSNGVHPNADAYNRTLYYKSKNYWSPLHHAVRKGYHEIVHLLLEHGGMFLEGVQCTHYRHFGPETRLAQDTLVPSRRV